MRDVLLLIEKSSHCLSYYDVATGTRLHSVGLPEYPHEFVLNADRTIAYIGHYGVINSSSMGRGGHTVLALDIAAGKISHILDLGEDNNRPHGIGMDASGRLYVLSEGSDKLLIWDCPDRPGPHDRDAPTGGRKSHLFALSADGSRAFSMNLESNDVTLFHPHDPERAPVRVETGEKPEGRLLRADGKVLFITNRVSETLMAIDTSTLEILATATCPGDPVRVFHDVMRGRLMTINYGNDSIGLFNDESLDSLGKVQLHAAPIAMSFDESGSTAFVSLDCNQVMLLDLETLMPSGTLQTYDEPDVSAVVALPDNFPG